MAMSSMAVQRRDRRRRRLALFLSLAVVITVVTLAVRTRTEERQTGDYLALVEELAREQVTVAQGFRELLDGLSDIERQDIVDRLTVLGRQADGLATRLDDAVVTRPAAEAHGFFAVASASWAGGLDAIDEGVVEVMDQPDEATSIPRSFGEAVDRLELGDAAYLGFLDAVGRMESNEIVLPSYPAVAYLGGEEPVDIDSVTARLRLRLSLAERHDVEVSATTSPEPTGDRNGVAIMPFAPRLDVTAVVSNSGNVTQEEIQVTLTLARDGGDDPPFEEGRIIPALDPAASVSVEFLGIDVEPAALYTLEVSVLVADDADFENNLWELVFATNAQ